MTHVPAERRRYPRFELSCPMTLRSKTGNLLVKTETVNISDGGALVLIPSRAFPRIATVLSVELQVPSPTGKRREFMCSARVLWNQNVGGGQRAIAIRFLPTLQLNLEALAVNK